MAKSAKKSQGLVQVFLLAAVIVAVIAVLAYMNNQTTSHDSPELSAKEQLSKNDCGIEGEPLININQVVVNDIDVVNETNHWALDDYDRAIKVWEQADGIYCAELTFEGTYNARPGALSPGNKQTKLSGAEDGTLIGSSRIIIAGTLKNESEWPKTGSVGVSDFQCDWDGNCPGYDKNLWYTKYFENIQEGYLQLDWYKWIYKNGDNVWVHASEGNSGEDIL